MINWIKDKLNRHFIKSTLKNVKIGQVYKFRHQYNGPHDGTGEYIKIDRILSGKVIKVTSDMIYLEFYVPELDINDLRGFDIFSFFNEGDNIMNSKLIELSEI